MGMVVAIPKFVFGAFATSLYTILLSEVKPIAHNNSSSKDKKFLDEAEILRKALPYPAFDISKVAKQTVFTTKPKTRRHLRCRISGNRAKAFMEHLWRKNFKSCHYKALWIQFVQYFETNDPRVVCKYIGRPKFVSNYYRESIKKNRLSGRVHKIESRDRRTLEGKAGLMEVLGYLSLDQKTGSCKLHHELMPYFTKQSSLKDVDFSRPFFPQKNDHVSQEVSKLNLCVSLGAEASKQQHVENSSASMEIEEKKEEEEECNSTHKSGNPRVKLDGDSLSNTETDGGSLSNTSEFEVSVLKLNGQGHYAYHCGDCGTPIKKNKTMLCRHCNGKRHARLIQRKRANKFLLDKEFLMKGVCPKCHRKGSLHKRWVTNGITKKRYTAYYFGHYDPEKQNVKWCYIPKRIAEPILSLSNSSRRVIGSS